MSGTAQHAQNRGPRGPSQVPGLSDASGVFCIICADKIAVSAVSPCNNVTCHRCSFRQRALYGKKTCLVCRTEHADVVFTSDVLEEAKYDDYVPRSRPFHLKEYGVHFTERETMDGTLALLSARCQVCLEEFPTFRKLSDHTKTMHNKHYCDICAQHKKVFYSELQLYTQKQLQKHLNGDADKSGWTGHPKCKFCHKRYYSEDEMNVHIRDMHERCHICNQDHFVATDYYKNYDDLFNHFQDAHYVCHMQVCLDKKFVVFREDLDLTAHMLKEHGGIVGLGNRLVIGSSAPKFRSKLSTFEKKDDESEQLKLKLLRFNERAKHYLKNERVKIQAFNEINNSFRSRKMSAQELLDKYTSLFSENEEGEIALLIYELVELLPPNTDQRRALQGVFDRVLSSSMSNVQESTSNANLFPLLAGSQSSNFRASTWGNGTSSRASRDEMFPTLAKPTKAPAVPKNAPIRYTTVRLTEKPKTKVNVFRENTSYKPSYLEAPRTGSSLQAPALSDLRFPPLEQKKKKPAPPPVKPIQPSTTTWGNGIAPPAEQPTHLNFGGIPITDKRSKKKKEKN